MDLIKKHRISELDGLRAFAVLAVIIFHMWGWAGVIPHASPFVNSLISCFGPAGVYVFFIISGFIITSLLIRENSSTGRVSLSAFYVRRFFRIIPPLVIYILGLFFLTQIKYLSINPVNYLWSILFLGNFSLFDKTGVDFLSHTWSLSVEEQYYLVLPPIMVSVFQFRNRPINILLIILFLVSLLGLNIAKVLSVYVHPSLISLASFYKFRYILVGVAIAFHRHTIQKFIGNKSLIIPIILFVSIYFIHEVRLPSLVGLFLKGVESLLWGFLVMWFVENPGKCGFLRWQVVQWLGACSYSIYLWQQLFTSPASSYNGWAISSSSLAIIPILIIAALSYYLIEKPSIRLGRYVSTKVFSREADQQSEEISQPVIPKQIT